MTDVIVTYEGRHFRLGLPPKNPTQSTGNERIEMAAEQREREQEIEALRASQEAKTVPSANAKIDNTPTLTPTEIDKSILETRTSILPPSKRS